MAYDDACPEQVMARYEATLDKIEASGRDLMPWEEYYLLSALAAIADDNWELARQEIDECCNQPDLSRTLAGITIGTLRRGLARVRVRLRTLH